MSRLLDKSMAAHGITEHPGPCGKAACCSDEKKFYMVLSSPLFSFFYHLQLNNMNSKCAFAHHAQYV